MPKLAVAMKMRLAPHIAETLVETYLGRDPGRRVLKGLIRRGVADRINAVLWFSDLRNFTRLSEQVALWGGPARLRDVSYGSKREERA